MADNGTIKAEPRQLSEEMLKYRRRLNELLDKDSPALFGNYSRDHADCIAAAFLRRARDSASILSGDFAAVLRNSPEVLNALNDALARGVVVRAVTLSGTLEDVTVLLDKNVREKLQCRVGRAAPGSTPQHYMVVDGKRYRLEAPHAMPAPPSVHAECCCNGPAKASFLRAAFDGVWTKLAGDVA